VLLSAARQTTGSVAKLKRHLVPCAVIPVATLLGLRGRGRRAYNLLCCSARTSVTTL
jgi:hypothetical protein